MKKNILILFLFLSAFLTFSSAQAQSKSGFGVKGGLNYNSNGKYFEDIKAAYGDPLASLGYNVGLFGKVNVGPFFVRPELVYAQMKTQLNSQDFVTKRFDAPLLVGMNMLGSLVSVFAGPAMHYRIADDLTNIDKDKFSAGYQFGAGVNFGIVGLDLRYERELSGKTLDLDRILTGADEFKFQQLTLNLSIKF
jgi:hypothetical protein